MSYKREYKRARWKLRQVVKAYKRDTRGVSAAQYLDLSKPHAVVGMMMKLRGLDQSLLFTGLYGAWHNVLRALENLHRHTSTK